MKPYIVQERNARQDIKIQTILDARKPLANLDFLLPCLVEEEPKKHYYRGKVEPLYRIAYSKKYNRQLEKGEVLTKVCCTANCSEPSHRITNNTLLSFSEDILIAEYKEEAIQSIDSSFEDYQF